MDTSPGHVTRRRVAQGAAWAVPAVVLASAAPAAAVSPGCITPSVEVCTQNQNFDHFTACFVNSCPGTSTITAVSVVYTTSSGATNTVTLNGVTVPQGPTPVCTAESGNSATWNHQPVTLNYTVDGLPQTVPVTPTDTGDC